MNNMSNLRRLKTIICVLVRSSLFSILFSISRCLGSFNIILLYTLILVFSVLQSNISFKFFTNHSQYYNLTHLFCCVDGLKKHYLFPGNI